MSITRVAKLAGVSSSTVSRVINKHPSVAMDTERMVRKAMEDLGYVPSDRRPGPKSHARIQAETKNIAFLVFGASKSQATPGFSGLLRGVSMGATEHDLDLTFNYVPDPDLLSARILDQHVDGLLLHGTRPGPEIEARLRQIPAVWLMGNRRRPEWGDQVMPDSYEVGHLAAEYLIKAGHSHLVFMNLDSGHWSFRQYCLAFTSTASSQGVEAVSLEQRRDTSAEYWGEHSPSSRDEIIARFMELSPRPTGIFIADNLQVAALQPALQSAGIEIGPGKTQIVSCNNEKPYLAGLIPRPAVIDIRVESIGRQGVEQLIWRMSRPHLNERLLSSVEPFLIDSRE